MDPHLVDIFTGVMELVRGFDPADLEGTFKKVLGALSTDTVLLVLNEVANGVKVIGC